MSAASAAPADAEGVRGVAARVAEGAVLPEALMRDALEAAEASAHLRAFTTLEPDAALARSRTAGRGPLAGVPFVVKDCIAAADHPLTGGTPALADHRPPADATVVARLRAAGAVLVGMTNLHELCFGITGHNDHAGTARNPLALDRVAGGSSSGTAVAIAAGVVPFGLTADTGGSARIPASFCGLVGFRPTTGRYLADGVLRLSTTRDTVGVMARRVEDVDWVDGVLAAGQGAVRGDPALPGPVPSRDPATLRLGVPRTPDDPVDPLVATVVTAALERLTAAGVTLVPVDLAEIAALDRAAGLPIVFHETRELWTELVGRVLGMTLADFVATIAGPDVAAVFSAIMDGEGDAAAYAEAVGVLRPRLQEGYRQVLRDDDLDAVAGPTVPVVAPLLTERDTTTLGGTRVPTFDTCIRTTSPASVAGIPSISVPAGRTADGLPVGLLLDGHAAHDRTLLAVAATVQDLLTR